MEASLNEFLNAAGFVGTGLGIAFAMLAVLLLMLLAVAGCVLPIIPGPILAFCAIVLWKFSLSDNRISYIVLGICLLLTVFAQFLDWWLPIKYTPSKSGAWGAFVGVFVGAIISIVFPPIALFAIFLSPLAFAFAFDFLAGGTFDKALKTGAGAFLGTIIAVFAKLAVIFAMFILAVADFIIN